MLKLLSSGCFFYEEAWTEVYGIIRSIKRTYFSTVLEFGNG